MTETLKIANKNFYKAIIHIFKILKENMNIIKR